MADSVFGDSSLFDEFDREPEPCDKILKQTLLTNTPLKQHKAIDDGSDSAFSAEFHVSSGSESEDSVSDNEFIENEDSDHGGGITGISDTLHTVIGKSTVNGVEINSLKDKPEHTELLKLKEKNEELERENHALRKRSRVVSIDKVTDGEGPLVQVVFMNNEVARKYKTEIEDFIFHLLLGDDREEKLPYLHLRPTSICLSERAEKILLPNEKIIQMQNSTAIGCGQFYREFVMDAMGWPLVEYNPALTDGWSIPLYEQFYTQSIPCEDEDGEDVKPAKKKRPKASCFNCDGEHNLRDCKERYDQRKIAKNRQEFMANNSPANQGMKMQRYIQKEKSNQQSRCKPGQISKELREALNLNNNQLPPYIYSMRMLGYPPGWLDDAAVFTSGMSMFDKHGNEVSTNSEVGEDGEIELNATEKKKFDIDMIVEYPGFNVDPPEGTTDECRNYGMPAMQACQSKAAFKLQLEPVESTPIPFNKAQKRRSDADGFESAEKRRRLEKNADMDLADSDDELSSQDNTTADSRAESSSQSLSSSQEDQIQAQVALLTDCDNGVEMVVIDSVTSEESQEEGEILDDDFVPPVPPTPEPPPLPPGTPPATPQTPGSKTETAVAENFKTPLPLSFNQITPTRIPLPNGTPPVSGTNNSENSNKSLFSGDNLGELDKSIDSDDIITLSSTPERPNGLLLRSPNTSSGSLSSTFGTPVLERSLSSSSTSTGKGLPEASKFASGITEHLPFENLPDATGKYQQMKKVLEQCRKKKK